MNQPLRAYTPVSVTAVSTTITRRDQKRAAPIGTARRPRDASPAGSEMGAVGSVAGRSTGSLMSSRMSTTITVVLSCPPFELATITSTSASSWGSLCRVMSVWIWASLTSSTSPSEHSSSRSPVRTSWRNTSTATWRSMPSARVTMLRRGCTRASSGVRTPSLTSSCT